MAAPGITPAQIPPGPVLSYYADLASGAVRPEDIRIEDITFEAIIDSTGLVVSQTSTVQVISTYTFVIRKLYAQCADSLLAGSAPGLIKFNLQEEGRAFTVFKQPVSFAAARNNPIVHDGCYLCIPGTQLASIWSVNTTLWAALVGATRIVSIVVSGDYIRCGPSSA